MIRIPIQVTNRKPIIVSIIVVIGIVAGIVGIYFLYEYYQNPQARITPNDEFFVVDIGEKPAINTDYWELKINGLVNGSQTLNYTELTEMDQVSEIVRLKCVDGPEGTAKWTGVRVRDILDSAGVSANATEVIFKGADGYTSSIDIETARKDSTIIALEMNDETLPREHGYPARLVVPDKYGYKWVKWITEIEVIDYDHKGYWESRGWDDNADIQPFRDITPTALIVGIVIVITIAVAIVIRAVRKQRKFRRE